MEVMLPDNADINSSLELYRTALLAASGEGHELIVKSLLKYNANINTRGENGETALHLASREGHEAVVRLLLEHSADINAQGRSCNSALNEATSRGHDAIMQLLLQKGALTKLPSQARSRPASRPPSRPSSRPSSRSHSRASSMSAGTPGGKVSVSITRPVDVNAQGRSANSTLSVVTSRGHDAISQFLLQKGASTNSLGQAPSRPHSRASSMSAGVSGRKVSVSATMPVRSSDDSSISDSDNQAAGGIFNPRATWATRHRQRRSASVSSLRSIEERRPTVTTPGGGALFIFPTAREGAPVFISSAGSSATPHSTPHPKRRSASNSGADREEGLSTRTPRRTVPSCARHLRHIFVRGTIKCALAIKSLCHRTRWTGIRFGASLFLRVGEPPTSHRRSLYQRGRIGQDSEGL